MMFASEEKVSKSISLRYTSRWSSNSDTVADIAVTFDNPDSDEAISKHLVNWLSAVLSLPHHARALDRLSPTERLSPTLTYDLPGARVNTRFDLQLSSRFLDSGDTCFDASFSFENPVDRQTVYQYLNIWLRAAGIALAFPTT